ncbi:MAG: type II toxin-antitoxin system VapC family toxin [Pseudomonadales bacterium]|jgi:tRNA(fMet)-specific endonuclease VapC|nr:type II toxin-antitoxin system VapC family toxin [Pseudomonadales bacterium]
MKTYMLDTNICSFIMREHPITVIQHLEAAVKSRARIVISAITYAEMRYGASHPKAPKKLESLVGGFVKRLDAILPWDAHAIEECVKIRQALFRRGTPIGDNDAAIAGHAIAVNCILVTNNTREFSRVDGLEVIDWR